MFYGMRISLTLRPDVVNKHDYLIYMPRSESHSYGVLPYVTRDGACGGPLKHEDLSVSGGDLSVKVI